jgi:ABC-type uncharacterized transport system substrate-binding protein
MGFPRRYSLQVEYKDQMQMHFSVKFPAKIPKSEMTFKRGTYSAVLYYTLLQTAFSYIKMKKLLN